MSQKAEANCKSSRCSTGYRFKGVLLASDPVPTLCLRCLETALQDHDAVIRDLAGLSMCDDTARGEATGPEKDALGPCPPATCEIDEAEYEDQKSAPPQSPSEEQSLWKSPLKEAQGQNTSTHQSRGKPSSGELILVLYQKDFVLHASAPVCFTAQWVIQG